jgi:hypothetical protein
MKARSGFRGPLLGDEEDMREIVAAFATAARLAGELA